MQQQTVRHVTSQPTRVHHRGTHHQEEIPVWESGCTCEACMCESDDRQPQGARHDSAEEGPAFEPI